MDDESNKEFAPDWSFWGHLPEVELWQAVALSLDETPARNFDAVFYREWNRTNAKDRIAWGKTGANFLYGDRYWTRMEIALGNTAPKGVLPIGLTPRAGLHRAPVKVAEFGVWALTLPWDMPVDFPGVIQAELKKYKAKDLWSESELQSLCCGLVPRQGRSATAELNKAGEGIMRAVLAKKLAVASEPVDATTGDRMYGHARFFDPVEATQWASLRFPKFPFKPADFDTSDDVFSGVDPADRPPELDIAMQAWRAVFNGYGDPSASFKSRLERYLHERHPQLIPGEVTRISAVANPNKERGRRPAAPK